MPQLPSLPRNAHLQDLFTLYGRGVPALLEFHQAVLRDEGALSVGEREFIAAYVSGLNACDFCHKSHVIYAELFGVDEGRIGACLEDLDTAPVDDRMRALLRYARKLNTLPSRLVPADAAAVLAAGASEAELYETILVTATFNMMNRIVEGTGVDFDYDADPGRHPATGSTPEAQMNAYRAFAGRIGKG